MTSTDISAAPFSLTALVIGALALATGLIAAYAGPFGPTQDVGVALGEIAGNAIKSTMREVFNRPQPEAVARSMSVDDWLQIGVVVAAVLAIVLAVFALFRHEARVLAVGALSVAAAALVFQFLAWMVLVIAGVMLIFSVMAFLGGGF